MFQLGSSVLERNLTAVHAPIADSLPVYDFGDRLGGAILVDHCMRESDRDDDLDKL